MRLGDLVPKLARELADELQIPYIGLLARVTDRPPQREMSNAFQQAANVRGAFEVIASPPAGPGVLLDDRRNSGWTLAMTSGQLRLAGAARVVPIAVATIN